MLHNMRVLAVGDHFFIISKLNKTSVPVQATKNNPLPDNSDSMMLLMPVIQQENTMYFGDNNTTHSLGQLKVRACLNNMAVTRDLHLLKAIHKVKSFTRDKVDHSLSDSNRQLVHETNQILIHIQPVISRGRDTSRQGICIFMFSRPARQYYTIRCILI